MSIRSQNEPGADALSGWRAPGPIALLAAFVGCVAVPAAVVWLDREAFGEWQGLIGAATGIAALVMLMMQFLSSGRFRVLTNGPGIDRTMRTHQLAARLTVLLVLAHVALVGLAAGARTLPEWATIVGGMARAPVFATGVGALALLVILVGVAILRNRVSMRYEVWRATHLTAAIVVAAMGLHHALALGLTSNRPSMQIYWGLLAALAMGSVVWVHLLKPWRLMRRQFRVVRNLPVGEGIRELVVGPPVRGPHEQPRALRYRAGQFVWLLVDQPPITLLDHPFSIASSPGSGPDLRFLIKEQGDFTSSLAKIPVGADCWIDGPFGNFTLDGRSGATIGLFAGGIGIAPILGLLEDLAANADKRPIGLVYGVRKAGELVGLDLIERLSSRLDLTVRLHVEDGAQPADAPPLRARIDPGVPTPRAIAQALRGEPRDSLCFICGPLPMMRAMRATLRDLGVPSRQIVSERFTYD